MSFLTSAGAINTIPDSVVSRTQDNRGGNNTTNRGVTIEPSQEWPKIGLKLSSNIGTIIHAYVHRVSDGTLMGETDNITKTSGDTITIDLDTNLVNGETYNVTVGDEGSSYTVGFYDSPTFPYTSSDGNLEITAGADGDTTTTTNVVWNVLEVGDIGL